MPNESDPQRARIEAALEAVMAGYVLHGNLHGQAIELPKIKIKEIVAVALATADRVDPRNPPFEELPPGQVWAWMHGPGQPHWEPRGTGVLLDA